jgi:two-component system, chemotaxis family, CheB/CheR fusion protein
LQTADALRASLAVEVPFVFLSGDIRIASLRDFALSGSVRLTKPVKPEQLLQAVRQLLPPLPKKETPKTAAPGADAATEATIFVIDDDRGVREAIAELLTNAGYSVQSFANGQGFLAAHRVPGRGCLVTDVRMPGITGFELLARLAAAGHSLPTILITGHGDVAMAVEAMRAGAVDFIEKPVRGDELLACIERALRHTPASPNARRGGPQRRCGLPD